MLQPTQYGVLRPIFHCLALVFLLVASPAHARELLIVAFGDSLTAGYGLKPGQGFAPQLESALKSRRILARVHNACVSGDTTAAGRARLGWSLNVLKAKPDLVIVELGGNDMLRGIGPDQTRANLDAILADLRRRGIRVVLAGMLASPNMGPAYGRTFNAIYPALARKHGVTLYPFFMKGVAGRPPLLLKDGIHPNAQGVAVIVNGILPTVATALGR